MEACPWSVGALREELNLVVRNVEPEREHQCDLSPSSQLRDTQLVRTKMRAVDIPGLQKYQLQHSSANSLDSTGLSLRLCNILKGCLSRASYEEDIVPELGLVHRPVSDFENSNQGNDLTQEERRAERNRKGRERSLRTRLRNAAHIKTLETACARLARENKTLRELVNCLKRAPPPEERLISIFRTILLSSSGLSSVFHPTAGRVEHLAIPPCSATSLTFPKGSSNFEELSKNQAASSTAEVQISRSSGVRPTGYEPLGTHLVPENDDEFSLWKPGQAEVSNSSKTSMTGVKNAVDMETTRSEIGTHNLYNPTNEILDQDRSVLAKFTLEDIKTCLSTPRDD